MPTLTYDPASLKGRELRLTLSDLRCEGKYKGHESDRKFPLNEFAILAVTEDVSQYDEDFTIRVTGVRVNGHTAIITTGKEPQ